MCWRHASIVYWLSRRMLASIIAFLKAGGVFNKCDLFNFPAVK